MVKVIPQRDVIIKTHSIQVNSNSQNKVVDFQMDL